MVVVVVAPDARLGERKVATMRLPLRSLGMILGLIGAAVGFVVSLLYSLAHTLGRVAGITADSSHFFIGLGLTALAILGALSAVVSGMFGAVLMLVAAVGFAFIVGWWAILPALFLLPAAWLAYRNRMLQGRAEPPQQPPQPATQ
jgi:hypothetical protein